MPDPLFQTLFADTDTASWPPAGVVRDLARRRTRRARTGAVVAAALAVAVVAGGVAFAGLGPAPGAAPGGPPPPVPAAPSGARPSGAEPSGAEPSDAASEALADALFLAPADVDPAYRVAAEGEALTGSWTYESRMGMLGCQAGAQFDEIARRDRSLVRGTRQDGAVMSQRIVRHRPGDAARYLQQVRDRVAACSAGGNGGTITIGAQRFAGQDALLIEDDFGAGGTSALVMIRQGDLVTQYEVVFDRDAQATLVTAARAAERLCGGTPAC
jgi:hypothetical protein